MTHQMIFASLVSRPVRTLVSVLAVALEVTLILVVVGLTSGISNETGKRTEGVGADIMVQPPNSSLFLALSTGSMPASIGNKLAEVEGVQAVAPVLTLVNSQSGLEVVYGIDPEKFKAISGEFVWHGGRMFQAPDEIVVDDLWAKANHASVGKQIQYLNHPFKISGIVEHGKGARVFMSLLAAQDLNGSKDRASLFYVKLRDPNDVNAVTQRIDALLPTYKIIPVKEYTSLLTSASLPALDAFIQTVVFVAVCIGVLVIFLSMYTTITERTREIGILRSLGASKRFIVSMIFQESVVVCCFGVILGLVLSVALERAIVAVYPTLVVLITYSWILLASCFAILSGIIGSLYPSIKAAAQDPIEALAYE